MNRIKRLTVSYHGRKAFSAHVLAVAKEIGINHKKATQIAQQVQECVEEYLSQYIHP